MKKWKLALISCVASMLPVCIGLNTSSANAHRYEQSRDRHNPDPEFTLSCYHARNHQPPHQVLLICTPKTQYVVDKYTTFDLTPDFNDYNHLLPGIWYYRANNTWYAITPFQDFNGRNHYYKGNH